MLLFFQACPQCRAQIVSRVNFRSGCGLGFIFMIKNFSTKKSNSNVAWFFVSLRTWLFAGVICLLGLHCGCCLIPFCVNGK